jgi:MoaA/NifB/PqqE/SkfB family radical SAM enzyme
MKPRGLRTLVLHVADRCDQACAHCSIWKGSRPPERLSASDQIVLLRQAREAGAGSVLFTGGEPFTSPDIERLVRAAREMGLGTQIATNGLQAGSAAWLSGLDVELFVSVEGPEGQHDEIRGRGTFGRLGVSLARLRNLAEPPSLVARHVLSARSIAVWPETVAAALALGFDRISFLLIDVSSDAFGGRPEIRKTLAPSREALRAFREDVRRQAQAGWPPQLVESSETLTAMVDRRLSGAAPRCDAPEWSSVVELSGAVRPCFFQPAFAVWTPPSPSRSRPSAIGALRREASATAALEGLHSGNEICRACVCPKYEGSRPAAALASLRTRVSRALW